ncbi:MAG: glutamate--tRNA ligase [Bacillota bacterium]|nr:glutamate--tRNA ligase [Bacillota bacterium]MDI9415079.1 glutamate--tRNA ligase [Bacillota bacterium]NLD12765.1 glutamate--tRNA ligase [Bacillota bacterium]HOB89161.1 glutamate--tRNA ligase [Bacillota bacterium]HOJ58069.1 glutamate--tRNA ligase [Bacillota bacterium]
MMSKVRVRFAPSPTGYLHIGGARTMLFNWLFARHHGGSLILRIEDTDVERSTDASTDAIIESIKWLGLDWDEGPIVGGEYGPYFQSERLDIYREYAERLLKSGHAYRCYCTPEELSEAREAAMKAGKPPGYTGRCRQLSLEMIRAYEAQGRKPALRFKVPEGETVVNDIVRGDVVFQNEHIDDFVILKSDGYPTYNFAVVIDDALMKITDVIRADEHLPNTPKQIMMYKALGFELPRFAHVSMILGKDKTKLSKRHGATSVTQYRDDGYLPEALINYLVLLGWAYDAEQQIFSREELIQKFTLDKVSKNPAIFDPDKLLWMNGHYIREQDNEVLVDLAIDHLRKAGLVSEEPSNEELSKVRAVVSILKERIRTMGDIVSQGDFFFTDEFAVDDEAISKFLTRDYVPETFEALKARLEAASPFNRQAVEEVIRGYAKEVGRKAGEVIHPLRVALTGRSVSPGIFEVMEILGKDACCRRIDSALKKLARLDA